MDMSAKASRGARIRLNRRSFLSAVGLSTAAIVTPSALTGCSAAGSGAQVQQGGEVAADVLPKHTPVEYIKPDIASVNGSTPGYTSIPEKLITSVKTPPGSGKTFKAMTPLWGTIPPTKGNQYYEAVNKVLGSTIEFQITDGNVYGDKLATVLASQKDIPDWVSVPGWNIPPRFGSEIVDNVFQDLTPLLSGDGISKWPNLANIPTDAWKSCVFNGKLYALPFPSASIGNAIFYRDDLLKEKGIEVEVKSADDLLDLAVELTDKSKNVWGADDLWNGATLMFGVPAKWTLDDGGALIHRVETPQYRAALEWNAKLFKSGAVHPDAVADKTGEAKARFQAGKELIMFDGLGGWGEALRDNLPTNPSYSQQPFAPIAGDGGAPVLYKDPGAGIFSFLKKNEDASVIEELLGLANVLAAPFGTTEYDLIQYGVEGAHYKRGKGRVPEPTALAPKELQPTYVFLVDPPASSAQVQYPGYVEDSCTWMADAAEYLKEPLFYGKQISEPAQFASIGQPFDDLEKDIARGRKSIKDLDPAIAEWKAAGGDELRKFYQDILDAE